MVNNEPVEFDLLCPDSSRMIGDGGGVGFARSTKRNRTSELISLGSSREREEKRVQGENAFDEKHYLKNHNFYMKYLLWEMCAKRLVLRIRRQRITTIRCLISNGIRSTGKFITFYVFVETERIFIIIITAIHKADNLHVQTSCMFTVISIVLLVPA